MIRDRRSRSEHKNGCNRYCADFPRCECGEAVAPQMPTADPYRTRSKSAWRLLLPYGKWTCSTGREVLYNRRYWPIWERANPDAPAVPANPNEFVEGVIRTDYYYNDGNSPGGSAETRRRCRYVLKEWAVPATPWLDNYWSHKAETL